MPFVHGGAEIHVRELVARAARARLRRRARQRSVQVVSEGGDPARTPPRGACSICSESNGRPIDLRHRARSFPTYFVRHPQQGRLADPSVPRRLRAVRHARTATSTHTEADVALRDTPDATSTREMLGECRRLFANARNTAGAPGEIQRPRRPSRCTIRRSSPAGCAGGPYGDYVLSVGPPRDRSSASTSPIRAMASVDRADAAGRRRRRHAARERRARWRRDSASPIASRFLGSVDDDDADRALRGRARRSSFRRTTRTSAT